MSSLPSLSVHLLGRLAVLPGDYGSFSVSLLLLTSVDCPSPAEMVSIASRHIMRVCLLTTRLREALLPTDLSVPLTHPPIHLPACLPDPCDAMAPCTTDSGDDHCTAFNNPFRGYECSGSTDSCTFNVVGVEYEEEDDSYFRMNPSSTCNDVCAHFNSTCLGAREGDDNLCAGLDAGVTNYTNYSGVTNYTNYSGVTSYTCTDPMSAYSHSWHIFCTCSSPAWTTGEYEWIACLNLT